MSETTAETTPAPPQDGGQGNGQPQGQPGGQAPPATEPAAQQPAPQGQPAAQQDGQPPSGDGQPQDGRGSGQPSSWSVDDLPSGAQKLIRDLRSEAATNRTRAKERDDQLAALQAKSQGQLDAIAQALGLKPEEATPEQIMADRDAFLAERDAERAVSRALRVEHAVFRAATGEGLKAEELLDSRSFVAKLDGLDPQAADFADRVRDLIREAGEADPRYKTAPPLTPPEPPVPEPRPAPTVPTSGGQFTGPPNAPRQLSAEDAANMSPSEVMRAMNEGLFAGEGYGPKRSTRR